MKNLIKEKSPITQFIDINAATNIMETPEKITSPWYGQLMKAPQILAYLIQIDYWLTYYNVQIDI